MSRRTTSFVRALDDAVLSLASLAEAAGFSYDSLMSWRSGRRTPGGDSLSAIADALERHADKLRRIADQLRKQAGR